jgi:hypothetical protein
MRSGRLRCWRVTDCTPITYCNSRRPGRQFRRPSPALRPAACQCVISRKTPASGCGTFMGSAYSRYASLIRVCQPRPVQKPRRWEAQSFHFFIPCECYCRIISFPYPSSLPLYMRLPSSLLLAYFRAGALRAPPDVSGSDVPYARPFLRWAGRGMFEFP